MKMGFGCVSLGSASARGSRREAVRLVEEAVDSGVTTFDTADAYGSGTSERVLGRALRARRSEVVIATKGGYVFRPRSGAEQRLRHAARSLVRAGPSTHPAAPHASGRGEYQAQNFSPDNLRRMVEASLRRLRTDHIDVYQLHGPRSVTPDLFERLGDLVTSGKVLRFGVGAESVSDAAAWDSVVGLDVLQLPFGVLDPEAADSVFPGARQRSVEIWARGVLGGGLLAAAERGPSFIEGEPKRPLIDALRRISVEADVTPYRLAIGFVRAHTDVSTILIGIGSREHLHRNLELMQQPPLPDDVMTKIRALFRPADGARVERP